MNRDSDRRVFHTLGGMRGVAAIAVLLMHAPDQSVREYIPGGYLAVDLFFVLSGFVLSHAYNERLSDRLTPMRFMVERVIRLYPLYLLGLGLVLWRLYVPEHP